MVSLIRSKLPMVVTVNLEQQKGTENEWTVKMSRSNLKRYITTQEIGENQFSASSEGDENAKLRKVLIKSDILHNHLER